MNIDYEAMGKRIKIARIKAGITQEALADKVGITPQHMSNTETGNSKVSLPTLILIANALHISVDKILCDNILDSKVIFAGEAKELFDDCNDYEIRLLVDILKASKDAIRKTTEFRDNINK